MKNWKLEYSQLKILAKIKYWFKKYGDESKGEIKIADYEIYYFYDLDIVINWLLANKKSSKVTQ